MGPCLPLKVWRLDSISYSLAHEIKKRKHITKSDYNDSVSCPLRQETLGSLVFLAWIIQLDQMTIVKMWEYCKIKDGRHWNSNPEWTTAITAQPDSANCSLGWVKESGWVVPWSLRLVLPQCCDEDGTFLSKSCFAKFWGWKKYLSYNTTQWLD